jgi:CO/xanthine dehydrogenase FAD-binding subunit
VRGPTVYGTIGAMTTHYEVLTSELVHRHCGLLAEATSTVADPAVRHRGTFGDSSRTPTRPATCPLRLPSAVPG